MINETLGHYRILEKIGEGGMGEVFLAEDTSLRRKVALKFLPPEMQLDTAARKRLLREAMSAAALDHPYICNVHEVGEVEGRDFIVMEYVDGQTLKDRLAGGAVPLKEALWIASEVAEALEHAHSKGIIHRDLKPANIMLTRNGHAKVMDFGLAKQLRQAEGAESTEATLTALTEEGTMPGTLAYMSPEQLRARPADARSDIFAFGIVLFEMLTGVHPFKKASRMETASAILRDPSPKLAGSIQAPHTQLEDVVARMLAKDPEQRYPSVHEARADLNELIQALQAGLTPRRIMRLVCQAMGSMIVIVSVAAVAWWVQETYFRSAQAALAFGERDWILITDFENLTGDRVFDRSLEVAMTVGIQQSRYVNVFPRNRVQATLQRMRKEKAERLDEELGGEIAQREGIKALVACNISRTGEAYALSARLINPHTREVVLTAAARAKGRDQVLDALDGLTKTIRENLGEALTSISDQNVRLPQATTYSLEALKTLVEARGLKDPEAAHNLMQEAVRLDPDFALAHADLGQHYYASKNDRKKGEEHFAKALSLLDRLTLRERLWIQAVADEYRGNREKASEYYIAYLARYPDDSPAWFRLGYSYLILRRCNQAVEAFKKHLAIDPSGAGAYLNIATCYMLMRDYAEAVPYYLKAFEIHPDFLADGNINHEFGFTYVHMGKIREAEDAFKRLLSAGENWKIARGHRSLALLNMYLGRYAAAIEHLKEAVLLNRAVGSKQSEYRDRYFLATAYRTKGQINAFKAELASIRIILAGSNLSPEYLSSAGTLYARAGSTDEASRLLAATSARMNDLTAASPVERSSQRDRAAHDLLKGEIELARGDYDEALNLFQVANKLSEGIRSSEPLAYCHMIRGEWDQAIAMYQHIISLKGLGNEDQEMWILAHYNLGRAYEQKGQADRAIEAYESFLNIWKDADPDLVALVDAKKRLARLKSGHRSHEVVPAPRSLVVDPLL